MHARPGDLVRRFMAATVGAGIMLATTHGWAAPLSDDAVRARADALISQMTPEEKAGQLGLLFDPPPAKATVTALTPQVPAQTPASAQTPPAPAKALPPTPAQVVETAVESGNAGALLLVTDPVEINRLQHVATEQTRLKIPLLFGFDVIHGLHTIFPVPLAMAASWDPKLVEDVQGTAAAEARAVGIDWAFAPMVDIARDPRWGRIVEGAGEDPYLGSAMAAAQVRGFQGPYLGSPGHIIAGVKHFAGYGASLGGRDYDQVELSDNELWNVYFPPFKAAIDAGAGSIMSAYVSLNGVPAAGNAWLLTKVLRDTWGFKGFVVTDTNAVGGLRTHGLAADGDDAVIRALKAGIDMELTPPGRPPNFHLLPAELQAGKISQAELDNAVRYVLEAKIRMGLFEHPFVDEKKVTKVLNDPAHLKLARVAAERSAVLLRNENGLLPLNLHAIKSIAVIGPLADSPRDMLGAWIFQQNSPPSDSVLTGLRTKLGSAVRIDYSEGVRMPARLIPSPISMQEHHTERPPLDETAEIQHAVTLAGNADVSVLVLGEAQDMSGEIASRSTFDLPGRQQELLDAVVATGKPVVVLLMSARPLDLKNTKAGAIMDIWYPGSAGGAAVANLLFGDAAPGGKLPYTWPRNVGQVPLIYSRLNSHSPQSADQRYWNESNAPAYPFGYGLSYTTFQYANLHVDQPKYTTGEQVSLSVDLTNTGSRIGDDVAQLYIHQKSGTSARPVRELKGFQRVSLKPGETRTLHFTLTPDDLRYWSAATGSWVQDASAFDVWVGGSSSADLVGHFDMVKP